MQGGTPGGELRWLHCVFQNFFQLVQVLTLIQRKTTWLLGLLGFSVRRLGPGENFYYKATITCRIVETPLPKTHSCIVPRETHQFPQVLLPPPINIVGQCDIERKEGWGGRGKENELPKPKFALARNSVSSSSA